MLKNNKGITMIALIVTIIVLLIITSVSLGTGYTVVTDIKIGRIISDMALVQAKAETIYEEYQFSGEGLVGSGPSSLAISLSDNEISLIETNAGVSDFSSWKWYQWDASVMESQGLNSDLIGDENSFYVNYETGEILYSKATTYDGTKYYSMTGLNYIYEND